MENQTHFGNALKYGIIMGGLLIIVSLILYLSGTMDVETGKSGFIGFVLPLIISIGTIIWGISEYKKSHGNLLTLGDGVKLGILIGLIGGIIVAIYNLVFFTFIEPDMIENMRDMALSQAEEQGQMDSDSENMMTSVINIFLSPGFFSVMTIIINFFLGLFVGLIAGAIMKNQGVEEI